MLVIEVEFLTGVSVAASPYRREEPEWPPHPDRLFQALVAAWGRDDSPNESEKRALEWLETLDRNKLDVLASTAHPRTVAPVFVPPNDACTTGDIKSKLPKRPKAIYVVPELRRNRQQRTFPAVIVNPEVNVPEGTNGNSRAVIHYIWKDSPGIESHHKALETLVKEVTYLGHPHTLVRVALVAGVNVNATDGLSWVESNGTALRYPHEGRLKHLESQYKRSMKSDVAVRPNPSFVTREFRPLPGTMPSLATLFDDEKFISFEDSGGFCPSLSAFPLVAKRFRDALLKIADDKRISIPTLLSGHNRDKRPTTEAHLSIVPLADVGWEYSQGRLMGLAVVLPRDADDEDRHNVGKVLAGFVRDSQKSVGVLHFGRSGSWQLSLSTEPVRASLRFGRYVETSKRWGTVLPVVLDRHPKDKPNQDISAIIASACRNIGLEVEAIKNLKVEVHQYAAVLGAPSAQEVARTLPKGSPYRNRPLVHLVLDFPHPIRGPLILGAGRFRGLGLCLPLE